MPVFIAKGRILRQLDAMLSTSRKKSTQVLNDLKNTDISLGTVYKIHAPDPRKMEWRHLDKHWFSHDEDAFWPEVRDLPYKESILRNAMIKALQMQSNDSGGTLLPIAVYWICVGDYFQSFACRGPGQITLIVLTPTPQDTTRTGEDGLPLAQPSNITLIASSQDISDIVNVAKNNPVDGDVPIIPMASPTRDDDVQMIDVYGDPD